MIARLLRIALVFAALANAQGPPPGRGNVPLPPFGFRFKLYEPEAIARGLPLYTANCASCHGGVREEGKLPTSSVPT